MYYSRVIIALFISCVATLCNGQNINFGIVGDDEKIVVPFKFVHNFIIVEVRLFGMLPMNFIFDTGAENTILLTKEFADFMDVEYDIRVPVLGSDLSEQLHALVARSVDIELIGLPPQKRDILVLEENRFNLNQITGIPIHGLLGGSFFRTTAVEIDFRKQKLTFHNPDTFTPPRGSYTSIPVDIENNKPYLNAETHLANDTIVNLSLLVDTGAGLPLLLNNDSHPSLSMPASYIRGQVGMGLGGQIEGYIGRVSRLSIRELEFTEVLTSFQEMAFALRREQDLLRNGLVGNQLLVRFDVVIDYRHETIYLRPRSRYKREFKMDRSGMILFATGSELNEYIVSSLIANSPAEESGLLVGDKLLKIQGLPARFYSLDQINRLMQKREGKRIKLTIKRGAYTYKVTFKLRSLI